MRIFLLALVFFFSAQYADASVVYSTPPANQIRPIVFPYQCIGIDCNEGIPLYVQKLRVPQNAPFRYVLMSASSSAPLRAYIYLTREATGGSNVPFESCTLQFAQDCNTTTQLQTAVQVTGQSLGSNLWYWDLGANWVSTSTSDFLGIFFDPNAPFQTISNNVVTSVGFSYNGWIRAKTAGVTALKLCDTALDCQDGNFTGTTPNLNLQFSPITSGSLNTRFLGVSNPTYNSGSKTLTVSVQTFIDSSELSTTFPNRKIELLSKDFNENGKTEIKNNTDPFTIISGTSTAPHSLFQLDNNKTYTARISFQNYATIYNPLYSNGSSILQTKPFPESYMYFEVTINNNVPTLSKITTYSAFAVPLSETGINGSLPCSLTSITGCITNAVSWLFIPSSGFIDNKLSEIVDTQNNSFLASALLAFDAMTTISSAQPDGNQLAYTLDIPQAGISVPMLSVASITQLFGSSLPIFRGIMILALWLGFFAMLLSSLWSRINGTPDPVQNEMITDRSATMRAKSFNFSQ